MWSGEPHWEPAPTFTAPSSANKSSVTCATSSTANAELLLTPRRMDPSLFHYSGNPVRFDKAELFESTNRSSSCRHSIAKSTPIRGVAIICGRSVKFATRCNSFPVRSKPLSARVISKPRANFPDRERSAVLYLGCLGGGLTPPPRWHTLRDRRDCTITIPGFTSLLVRFRRRVPLKWPLATCG